LTTAQFDRVIWYLRRTPALNTQGKSLCPLCKQPDSGTHIVGGCTSPTELAGLNIKRHDAAVQTIRDCICTDPMSTAAFFMDAGRSANCIQTMRWEEAIHFRSGSVIPPDPAWLPEHPHSITRSDIVVIQVFYPYSLRAQYRRGWRLSRGQENVLLEVGYCADTQNEAQS
jgi:hypothetical protein